MRILIIIGSFKVGGAERMSVNTGEELLKRGYDVHYIVQRPIFEIPHSIPKEKIHVLRKSNSSNLRYKISALFLGVYRVSKRIDPDIIIGFSRFSSFLANFTFHNKIIARFDAYPYRMSRKQRIWADLIILSPLIKKIIVPSSDMLEAVAKKKSGFRKKLYLLPNSIDPRKISRKSKLTQETYDFKFISAMGRLSAQKNFKLLIKAFAKSKLLNSFKLIILGEGNGRENLENLIKYLKLQDKVILTGRVDNPFPIISQSSFFANASHFEGLSNVILEALVLGKPVVATNCPFGTADMVIDNYNGFLVKNNNLEDMVEKLNLMGVDQNKIEEFQKNTFKSVEKFFIKKIGDKWEDLIKGILNS